MSTATSPIVDQAGVNGAGSFESAADSLLGIESNVAEPEQTQGTAADAGNAGDNAAAGGNAEGDKSAATATAEQGQEKVAAETTQADEWAVDQTLLDKLFADPTHGEFAKQLYEKYQKLGGYREHWTLDEARDARALAPGGLDELKTVVQAGRDAKVENEEFASADPARQGVVLQSLAKDMPEAFAAGAKPYLETLKATSPDTYRAVMMEGAKAALEADGVPALLNSLLEAVAGDADDPKTQQAFTDALKGLQEWTGKAGFSGKKAETGAAAPAKVSPEIQKALDENKAFKENAAKETMERFGTWKTGVDEGFQKSISEEATKGIDAVLPKNMPAAARAELSKRLTSDVLKGIDQKLAQDTDLGKKVAAVIANNAWKEKAEETKQQVQNLLLGRAKQFLPHVAREILNPFTEAQVASNATRVEKEARGASQTDIRGGAASGGNGRKPMTVEDMKGRGAGKRMSDEDILNL
jgi:hypothetical protein